MEANKTTIALIQQILDNDDSPSRSLTGCDTCTSHNITIKDGIIEFASIRKTIIKPTDNKNDHDHPLVSRDNPADSLTDPEAVMVEDTDVNPPEPPTAVIKKRVILRDIIDLDDMSDVEFVQTLWDLKRQVIEECKQRSIRSEGEAINFGKWRNFYSFALPFIAPHYCRYVLESVSHRSCSGFRTLADDLWRYGLTLKQLEIFKM